MRFKLRLVLLFFLVGYLKSLNAQNKQSIRGHVTDLDSLPLIHATVTLKAGKNKPIIAFASTNDNGTYNISTICNCDSLILNVIYLGYENKSVIILGDELRKNTSIIKNFALGKANILLKDVIIKPPIRKVRVFKDTITFTADSFRNKTDRTTEELLKRLPGVDVDKNGSITANGKSIKTVLIEGDNLFNGNYKMLTKNMNADVIDKVQIIDKYIDNPLLKGIANSHDEVLNITLKKDRKKLLFGNANLSIGNNGRYDYSSNLISIYNKTKFFLFDNYNTIGRDHQSEISQDEDQSKLGSLDQDQPSNILQPYKFLPNGLDEERVNFNHTKLASLTFITRPTQKITINGLGYVIGDRLFFNQINNYTYFINPATITINERNNSTQNPLTAYGYLKLAYMVQKNALIDYTFTAKHFGETSNTNIKTDTNTFFNLGINNTNSLQHSLNYTNRISQNKLILCEGIYTLNNLTQTASLQQNSIRLVPFTPIYSSTLSQNVTIPTTKGKVDFKYTYGNADNSFSLEVGGQLKNMELKSSLDTGINKGNFNALVDTLKNNFILKRARFYSSFSANLKIIKNTSLNLTTEINAQRDAMSKGIYQQGSNNYFYLYPQIALFYRKSYHSFTLNYSYKKNFTDINNIYTGFILTNYRTLQNGGSQDLPTNTNSLGLNYAYTNYDSGVTYYTSYFFLKQTGGFTDKLTLNNYFDIYSKTNNNDIKTTSIYTGGLNVFIPILSSTIKFRETLIQSSSVSQINSINTNNTSVTSISDVSLRSAFKGPINIEMGTNLNFIKTKNTNDLTSNLPNTIITSNYVTINLDVLENWSSKIGYEGYYFNSAKSEKKAYNFLDFYSRYVLKKDRIDLTLEGKNLFNNRSFINTSVNSYSTSIEQYNIIPAYLLLGISFKL